MNAFDRTRTRSRNALKFSSPRHLRWGFFVALGLSACGGGGGSTPVPPTPTLSVAVAGSGFVESTPAGIDCRLDCTKAYALDTAVTLVPFAGAGQTFVGWSGDADCSDGRVTMSAARNCVATFAPLSGVRIAAGKEFSVARSRSGASYSWGSDSAQALGNGAATPSTSSPTPTSLAAVLDTIAASATAVHVLSVEHATDRVLGWGDNWAGQLGDRSQIVRADAVPMRDEASTPVTNAVAAAVGGAHSLMLRGDGSVWAVGLNDQGQLGNGTTQSRDFAAPVPDVCGAGVGAAAVAAGADFSLALCADGSVRAWGANGAGQLGHSSFAQSSTPIQVSGLKGHVAKAIAAGGAFSLALDADGFVWSWGRNARGQLGTDPTLEVQRNSPAQVHGFVAGAAIAAGLEHAMVVLANNVVFAWGANEHGQVSPALGGITQMNFVFRVDGLPSIVEIAAGATHSLAVDSAGKVWAWGDNTSGQLGLGTTTAASAPMQVGNLNLN